MVEFECYSLRSLIPARVVKLSDRVEADRFEQVQALPGSTRTVPDVVMSVLSAKIDAAVINSPGEPPKSERGEIVLKMYGA